MTLSDGDIQDGGKLHGKIYRKCMYTRLQEIKYYMNIGPLKNFPIYNLMEIKENILRVHFVVP